MASVLLPVTSYNLFNASHKFLSDESLYLVIDKFLVPQATL